MTKEKLKNPNKVCRHVCYHEAGHIIGIWFTGGVFKKALVRTESEVAKGFYRSSSGRLQECAGVVDGVESRFFMAEGDYKASEKVLCRIFLKDAEMELIGLMGGAYAQGRYCRQNLDDFPYCYEGDDELDEAERIGLFIKEHHRKFEKPSNNLQDWDEMPETAGERLRLIFRIRGVWKATKELAETLYEKRRLTYKQSIKIIKKHTGVGEKPKMIKFNTSLDLDLLAEETRKEEVRQIEVISKASRRSKNEYTKQKFETFIFQNYGWFK
jgi:hypothetical protein